MVPVLPGLFVGGAAAGVGALRAAGVGALLSVDAEAPPPLAGIRALHIPARDEPGADLLSHLDSCAAFLSAARAGGGAALVRCHAGVSRSIALVTAYLMKTNNLTFEEAYAKIKAIKPDAKMNEGFEWQLKLYEGMGCKVDVSSAIYKQYRLQKVTEKYSELQNLPQEVFAVDPTSVCQTLNSEILYRCRKCRIDVPSFVTRAFWPTLKEVDQQPLLTRGLQILLNFVMTVRSNVPLISLSRYSGWSQFC
ncbi:dual specificity protein phosphatase 12 isoform X2 [Pelodiscus sinensis]|uniref:dual specificity protein phosphatase 12 isoform X2 n=1 Tax=Pelodiscus sinensis TaxID=13735 RepID=UPI003F6BAE66